MIYPAPSYLTGLLTAAPGKILSAIQNSYGDNTTAFTFDKKFTGLIKTWLAEYDDYGGTVWGLDADGQRILFFDQSKHGYNAVIDQTQKRI